MRLTCLMHPRYLPIVHAAGEIPQSQLQSQQVVTRAVVKHTTVHIPGIVLCNSMSQPPPHPHNPSLSLSLSLLLPVTFIRSRRLTRSHQTAPGAALYFYCAVCMVAA